MSDLVSLPQELLNLAKETALKAGNLLCSRPVHLHVQSKSSAVDLVTQMDKASESLIMNEILKVRPTDGFIGEEGSCHVGGATAAESGITWVVDPIDGTTNYFYNLPGWSISIAAKNSIGVLIGVVYAPSLNRMWEAVSGGGAFMNGQPIACRDPVDLKDAVLGTGFSYNLSMREQQARQISSFLPRIRDMRRCGSAAVDLCHVAMGALDGYYEYGLCEWDYAAGGKQHIIPRRSRFCYKKHAVHYVPLFSSIS
jgi:myo-inositol-1(or 4)-monophosphatase